MPSRAFHHKSRHGCLACKQRRKRCDRRSPTCTGCARRRSACIYDPSLISASAINPFRRPIIRPLATEWATVDPSVQAILFLQTPHVGFCDIEMIYNFKTRAPTTLDTMPGIFGVRHLDLVKKVPDYPYLLYGLITASALHTKSSIQSPNESNGLLLEDKATNFYQLAISAYRSRLSVIDENTCHTIFAFSVTLAALTFGLLHPRNQHHFSTSQTYINGMIDIFDLLLGAVAIAYESRAWIPISFNEPLLMPIRACLNSRLNSLEGEAQDVLDVLPSEIHAAHMTDCSDNLQNSLVDISIIYESVIPELRNVFFCLRRPEPSNILGVVGWPAFVGKPFVSLLKQNHPAALVVLAHYAVALQHLNQIWWLQGVGSKVIESVADVMIGRHSESWKRILQWPLRKIKNPQLNEAAYHAGCQHSPSHHNRKAHAQGNARPFEMALVITQIKGVTGPYYGFTSQVHKAV